MSNLLLRKL